MISSNKDLNGIAGWRSPEAVHEGKRLLLTVRNYELWELGANGTVDSS